MHRLELVPARHYLVATATSWHCHPQRGPETSKDSIPITQPQRTQLQAKKLLGLHSNVGARKGPAVWNTLAKHLLPNSSAGNSARGFLDPVHTFFLAQDKAGSAAFRAHPLTALAHGTVAP